MELLILEWTGHVKNVSKKKRLSIANILPRTDKNSLPNLDTRFLKKNSVKGLKQD